VLAVLGSPELTICNSPVSTGVLGTASSSMSGSPLPRGGGGDRRRGQGEGGAGQRLGMGGPGGGKDPASPLRSPRYTSSSGGGLNMSNDRAGFDVTRGLDGSPLGPLGDLSATVSLGEGTLRYSVFL
jgi:hypothetical protein